MAEIGLILGDETKSDQIFKSEKSMLELNDVSIWNLNAVGNNQVKTEIEFEMFLASISEHTTENLDNITIFKCYALMKLIIKKNENNK